MSEKQHWQGLCKDRGLLYLYYEYLKKQLKLSSCEGFPTARHRALFPQQSPTPTQRPKFPPGWTLLHFGPTVSALAAASFENLQRTETSAGLHRPVPTAGQVPKVNLSQGAEPNFS